MTESDSPPPPPPKGGQRPAVRPRVAPAPQANGSKAPPAAPQAGKQPSPASTPIPQAKAPQTPSAQPGAPTAKPTAAPAQRPRPVAAGAEKTATSAPTTSAPKPQPVNGTAKAPIVSPPVPRAPAATAAVRPASTNGQTARGPAASSAAGAKAAQGPGEPYPPISQRPVTANSAASTGAKTQRPITPRSPRTALEPDTVQIPTRRSKSARHPFVIVGNAILSVFVLVAIAAGAALVIGKQRFDAPGPLPESRIVNIPRGSGIHDIADVLVSEGVIDQPWVFVGGVFVLKAREDLKAGEYQFKAHASLRDVVATIVEGRVVTHQFTMPEGLTSEQIVARLLDDPVLVGNIKEVPREGSLLPDTYNFTRGVTREQMIQRMQQAQQHLLKEIWDRHSPDLPIKTPDQLVVLASLVEKETGEARGAHPHCRGIRQPAKTKNAAAIRPDHHLWAGRRQGYAGSADHEERDRTADGLQHLPNRRIAAGADRQPWPCLTRGCGQSGTYPRALFRRRRHWRACIRGDLRTAPEERRAATLDGG